MYNFKKENTICDNMCNIVKIKKISCFIYIDFHKSEININMCQSLYMLKQKIPGT